MPPSEASILSNFLLTPAPLRQILTLREFTELFPPKHHANPTVAQLYRELQQDRQTDMNDVRRFIAMEVKRGEKQRRQVSRTRQKSQSEEMARIGLIEIETEAQLSGNPIAEVSQPHTLQSIKPAIDHACAETETRIANMEAELATLMEEVDSAVSDLSDLRYGRFTKSLGSNVDMGADVLQALDRLKAICQDKVDV